MIRRAIVLGVAFVVLHVLGAREHVGFLSGTVPAGDGVPVLGALYVMAWFGVVLVAPILVIAAGFEALVQRALRRRSAAASAGCSSPGS